ncbi:MAG: ABC transporter substrate-binding protein [Elusimicrobia bacterium]|nr:ABC transporter substrate-binding protein [Elusimicrobiota bacterium]
MVMAGTEARASKVMRTLAVVLVVLLAAIPVLMAGCKSEIEVKALEQSMAVVDAEGNVIELASPAEKIIVIAPSALEIIDGLGAMDRVVEVDSYSVGAGDPLAEGFEGAGDSYGLNIERIAGLNPDILIAVTGGSEDDYQKIKELGIKIYRVININGIEGIYEEITNISKLIGLEDRGEKLVKELKEEVEEIHDKVKDLSSEDKPKVFYEVWNDPLMSAGTDTFINDLIEKSGGINIVAEDSLTGWPEYSVETLIKRNPDIIIAPVSLAADPSVIINDTRFSSITAVIEGRVYLIPDNPVSRPSQNSIKALQMLSKAIHPEIFGKFEIIE